jgi:4-amino-4-deoxy-L-arabinose transferase-like glycosyltransferase
LPLLEPEEARYAEIPRQMLAEGSWFLPVLHGQPYLQKPPLFYWLVMGVYELFGVHDWAARLVPGFIGWLIVLVAYLWGREIAGNWAAVTSASILALMPRFVFQARLVTMDGLLCLCVVASWAVCRRAVRDEKIRWTWWLAGGVLCGLGLLAKGPVVLAIVMVPLFLGDVCWERKLRWTAWVSLVLVAVAVAAPWYIGLVLNDSAAAWDFFWLHHVTRYVAAFDHVKPLWYYVPILLVGTLPWSLLLVPLVRRLARLPRNDWPRGLGFCLLCLMWCVGFFSLSECKRPGYILPAYPALAVMLGTYVASLRPNPESVPRTWPVAAAAVCLGMVVAGWLLLDDYHRHFALRGQVRRHRELVRDEDLQVACFPRGWDSVSFYLQKGDVRAFSLEESAELVRYLEERPTLVFVKKGAGLEEMARVLSASLELIEIGRQSEKVFVGVVRRSSKPTAWRSAAVAQGDGLGSHTSDTSD